MKIAFEAGIRKSNSPKKHSECWKEWLEEFNDVIDMDKILSLSFVKIKRYYLRKLL